MTKRRCFLHADVEIEPMALNPRALYGQSYAIPFKGGNTAVSLMAWKEGLFLDRTIRGKAFAGLTAMVGEGAFKSTDNVLFIHTGGVGELLALS